MMMLGGDVDIVVMQRGHQSNKLFINGLDRVYATLCSALKQTDSTETLCCASLCRHCAMQTPQVENSCITSKLTKCRCHTAQI